METSKLTEAMATLEWVQEHLDAVGGEHKRVYIDGLRSVWELLDLIRKKGDIYERYDYDAERGVGKTHERRADHNGEPCRL